MAPIVAPGICRYTINQTYGAQQVANILDMQIDTTGGFEARSDAIRLVGEDILKNWDEHILQWQVPALVAQNVSWVDLDSLDGDTGSTTDNTDDQTLWPKAGYNVTAGLPGNVSMLVKKISGGGRRARNGKWFICGVPEVITTDSPNTITSTEVPLIQALFDDFADGITDNSGPIEVQRQPVVLHTVNGVFTSYDDVDRFEVQSLLATQRRRLRD